MTPDERRVIEDLFEKLAEVDRRTGLREPEAEALIARLAGQQPGAAYYMAQAIVAQERALEAAQGRIQDLEERAQAPQGSGGFLSGIFGTPAGGAPVRDVRDVAQREVRPAPATSGPWGSSGGYGQQPYGRGGSGFLGGAAQTAMGVAGGVVLGSFLADMLTPDAAVAGEAEGDAFAGEDAGLGDAQDPAEASDMGDTGDMGEDFGGDFGGEL